MLRSFSFHFNIHSQHSSENYKNFVFAFISVSEILLNDRNGFLNVKIILACKL